MRLRKIILSAVSLFVLGAALISAPAPATDSLRCGSRIVSTGDLAASVLAACGRPAYRDRWHAEGSRAPANLLGEVEEWYYNFGSNQLLWILRFRNGRLRNITSDGHGYSVLPTPDCPPVSIVEGLSKFRLLLHCGEPLTREAVSLFAPRHHPRTGHILPGHTPVYRERWVYNFGPRYLMRVVTLEDGRVVDVDTSERGSRLENN